MFYFEVYENKNLFGMKYRFPKRGDGIGMHDHAHDERHNIAVLKGSVEVYGPQKEWSKTLTAGDVMDLDDKQHPHEIVALEDDTRLFALNYTGKPEGLGHCELHGVVRRPLSIALEE